MKHNITLTIASLLSILFMTFHLSEDIVRGIEPGGLKNIIGVLMMVVWLYGATVLADGARDTSYCSLERSLDRPSP